MNAIVVEGLTKRFGTVEALAGIDFEVPEGTVFGLLGPNGAGKTTAVRILSTILTPDGGRATVLGHDVVRDPWGVRAAIGLAGQFAAVDPNLTGTENLVMIGRLTQMPRAQIKPRAAELLELFDLSDAADRPVRTYSGGMRRRLDLAAALVHRPRVLFLDEPTTGLDPQSRAGLWQVIRTLVSDGTTVLLTTQYLEEADKLAGKVAVIDGGRVIALDAPDLLKSKLGDTVVEITLADDAIAAEARARIENASDQTIEQEGPLLRIASAGGPRILIEVLRALDGAKLEPESVAVREPSLDDVFLALTGHHAAEAEPAPAHGRRKRGAR